MESSLFFFVNSTLIMGCAVMALVFLVLPLPAVEGLNRYRISLRFLSGAYLIIAILKLFLLLFHEETIDIFPVESFIIASFQAPIFTFALITLIQPKFVTKHNIYIQFAPTFILIALYLISATKWGDPELKTFEELRQQALQPSIIIREVFVLYYLSQLFNLTRIFRKQAKKYKAEIDNYFSENFTLQLSWVSYCFYAALAMGVCAFLSGFLFTEISILIFTVLYGLFYLIFGLFYIQYPRTFLVIEPVIYSPTENTEKQSKTLLWNEIRCQIIEQKLYLQQGITVNDMAKIFNSNRTSFSVMLNKNEKQNFNSFINYLRIEYAKTLLVANKEFSILEIAQQCGFSEQSNFTRQFKQLCDETPAAWIKNRNSDL